MNAEGPSDGLSMVIAYQAAETETVEVKGSQGKRGGVFETPCGKDGGRGWGGLHLIIKVRLNSKKIAREPTKTPNQQKKKKKKTKEKPLTRTENEIQPPSVMFKKFGF